MLELNAIFNRDDVATDSEAITTILQNLTDPITNQLNELTPNIEVVNNVVRQMHEAITVQRNVNVAQINNLHDQLHNSVTQIRPQVTATVQIITYLFQQIREISTQFENNLNVFRGRLEE